MPNPKFSRWNIQAILLRYSLQGAIVHDMSIQAIVMADNHPNWDFDDKRNKYRVYLHISTKTLNKCSGLN